MTAVVVSCVSVTAALAANPYVPQLRYTAADQRLARSVVLEKADLPDLGGTWKGGFIAPIVEGDPCLGAKQSDLVVTGAAETEFDSDQALINSNVWVLKTKKMVRLDASRQPSFAVEARCARALADETMRIRSVSKLAFPAHGVKTEAIRVTYDLVTNEGTTRQIDDWITVFFDRFELSLALSTDARNGAAAIRVERSLIELLVRRVTPVKLIGATYQYDVTTLVAGAPFAVTGFYVRPNRIGDFDNTGSMWSGAKPDAMRCDASIGAVVLPRAGTCRWMIPADANGKTLKLVVNASYKGANGTFRYVLPIGIGA
jgi:hypothetical protein